MDDLKNIFGDKALTYDDFAAVVSSNENIQLANIAGGAYVSRSEYDTLQAKFDGVSGQLSEANRKLEGIDPEWKTKVEQAERQAKETVEKIKFDYALNAALTSAKARNTTAVKALLDMDGLKLNDNNILGLKEQLEKIKTENSFLFDDDKPEPSFGRPTPGIGAATGSEDKTTQANAALRAAFGKGN